MVFAGYPPAMSTSPSRENEPGTRAGQAYFAGGDIHIHLQNTPSFSTGPARGPLGVLRIEIHGSWSVADLVRLLQRAEDGYKAAAALESLTAQPSASPAGSVRPFPGPPAGSDSWSADELLQATTAFRLAGGLRLGSVHYGSSGFLDFIGALSPLKTVKDGITENLEINRKRDETLDQQQQGHSLEVARLQMQAEQARFDAMTALIDRLPRGQQSVAAAQLLQRLMGATEAIANDARIAGAKVLEQGDGSPSSQIPEARGPREEGDERAPVAC